MQEPSVTPPPPTAERPRAGAAWLVVAPAAAGVDAALRRRAAEARVVRVDGAGPVLDGLLRGRDWDAVVVAASAGDPDATVVDAVRLGRPAVPVVAVLERADAADTARWRAHGVVEVVARGDLDALAGRLRALDEPLDLDDPPPNPADAAEGRRWLDALVRFQADVARAEDVDAALAPLATALAATAPLAGAEVWRPDEAGLELVQAAAQGIGRDPALRDAPANATLTPRDGLVRHVYERRQPAAIADLSRGDRAPGAGDAPGPRLLRADAARALGVRAVAAAPVVADGAVRAVALVWVADPDAVATATARLAWWAHRGGEALAAWAGARGAARQRRLLWDAVDAAPVGLVACDAAGRLTLANAAMTRTGFAGLVGDPSDRWRPAWALFASDARTPVAPGDDPLSRALRGESLEGVTFTSLGATGRVRRWRVHAAPWHGDDGALGGAHASFVGADDDAQPAWSTSDLVLRDFRLLLDRAAELAAAVGEARELADVWPALDAFVQATTPATRWRVDRADGTGGDRDRAPRSAPAPLASGGRDGRPAALATGAPRADRHVSAAIRVGDRHLATLVLEADQPGAFDERHATAATMAANLVAVAVDHADLIVQERRLRAEAEASASHFRTMFQATPLAVALADLASGHLLEVNPAFCALVDAPAEALVGRPLADLEASGLPMEREVIRARLAAGIGVHNLELSLAYGDRRPRRCLVSAERTELHGRAAVLVTAVDVSERVAQEERLRQMAAFREQLMAFVEQTLEEGFEGASFFQRLVESAVAATPGAEAGSLLLRDDDGDVYRFVAAVGYDLSALAPATFLDEEIRASADGATPVVVHAHPEATAHDERAAVLHAHGRVDEIRATLTVPIVLGGRRVAALCLDSFGDPDAFGEDAHRLAGAFGAQVAALVKRRALEQALERMAYHDHLTGLPNRILFRDRLVQAIARARRTGRRGAALFLDLDNLKVTNDTLGHAVGDALLRGIAQRLQAAVRAEDTVARIGGDEFTVVLPEVQDAPAAARVAEKLLDAFRTPFSVAGHEVHATASIGVTLFPDDASDADVLIQHGDTAMYHAKFQGKDRYRFFTRDMNRALMERASLEAQLRKALERDEFTLHFQPRVSLRDGRITSVEALARWEHPERGWIPPDAFIPVAEESGLIAAVGRRLLELACAQGRRWVDAGTPVTVAFNVSARQLQERDLVGQIEAVLQASGLAAEHLEVELTESTVMRNVEENVAKLAALRALGVRVSIDDFGTAYSSLNYLKRLPATALKVDRSFVADLDDPERAPHDAGIVRAIVALAHTLELTAIAEGIETPAQLAFLQQIGCDQGQGYLLGRPAPASTLDAVLAAGVVPLPEAGAADDARG